MTNDQTPGTPLFLSWIAMIFAWITRQDAQIFLTLIATGVSIVAGILACRLYLVKIKATKEKIKTEE